MSLNVSTMRGVMYYGVPYQVNVTNLPVPAIQEPTDALVRITTSALCGSDMHMYHGYQGDVPSWQMGHEAMGYIAEIGHAVSSLAVGDYVVIPDNVASGHLDLEPRQWESFGVGAGLDGLQAEYARVPFADDSLIPVPLTHNTTNATMEQNYVLLSDIFPTGYTAVERSGMEPGDTVAVFGAGPVGLIAVYTALMRGASKVYSIDHVPMRLAIAERMGAIPINFAESDPVQQIMQHEPSGVKRAVDCVGMEAVNGDGETDSGIVISNMLQVTAQGGGIGQVGVYLPTTNGSGSPLGSLLNTNITFSAAEFFAKGLSFKSGIVDPLPLAGQLIDLIASGRANPAEYIGTASVGIEEAPEYYRRFSDHEEVKVFFTFP
ncbi:S-(hydroxymethyl)glutathione dehydrogenase [Diplodia seriata]|uniref:S-(Hydroxymethyl)glutathione dehydrogenase n=1 Tax=Diplodia seriata TaxID=420778 RepID=A0A1S8BAD7_9PEZI|nr:S-(hydroxymethyl)glutathione dehydrogenase [Diplodia seriata]